MSVAPAEFAESLFVALVVDQTEQLMRTALDGGESDQQAANRAVAFIARHAPDGRISPELRQCCMTIYLAFAEAIRNGETWNHATRASA
jgi:hypothetical protein